MKIICNKTHPSLLNTAGRSARGGRGLPARVDNTARKLLAEDARGRERRSHFYELMTVPVAHSPSISPLLFLQLTPSSIRYPIANLYPYPRCQQQTGDFTSQGKKEKTILLRACSCRKEEVKKTKSQMRERKAPVVEWKVEAKGATGQYDKLIIRHNNADASGKKKRTLPTSPQDNDPTGTKQRIQVNKTQTGQQRSSSLSEGVLKPGILSFLTNKNSGNLANEQLDRNIKQ
ncbi:hypothetical protein EVAR_37834_1 [Eumeta japonica]|uniref:Uncharacterized protein n=1 Tax=Eumeta variegata TaxID=151549 RepID=A0A4C1X4I1_EUMVA|nr:hypothetical protein EVAR_37834_1 [Eumeta japonica]